MIFQEEQFLAIIQKLKQGEVLILPSDTIYGFSGDPQNSKALKRVQKIKGRATKKPLVLLVPSFLEAETLCHYSLTARKLLNTNREPLTLILPRKTAVLPDFFPQSKTFALRIVQDPLVKKFLHIWGKPLFSTSVNLSQKPPLLKPKEIQSVFPKIPLYQSTTALSNTPSSIFSVEGGETKKQR